MEVYSVILNMEEMGHKYEYQLYFASREDAKDYLSDHPDVEDGYTIHCEYIKDEDFFFDYNQTIEINTRNALRDKYEAARLRREQNKAAERVEPKMWLVEIGDAQKVYQNWSDVQSALSAVNENVTSITINPISVAELINHFNA